jgi:hypothetical protein
MDRRSFLRGLLATAAIVVIDPSLPKAPAPLVKSFCNFDQLVATTLANYRPLFAKNITEPSVPMWVFKGEKKYEIDGGKSEELFERIGCIGDGDVCAIEVAAAFNSYNGGWYSVEDRSSPVHECSDNQDS